MLLSKLTKVYITKPERKNIYGEYVTKWIYVKEAYLNLQQDVDELDRNSVGEINYDVLKARTDRNYCIQNGYGISIHDDRKENAVKVKDIHNMKVKDLNKLDIRCFRKSFITVDKPEYRVLDQSRIGDTYLYRLEQYHGN